LFRRRIDGAHRADLDSHHPMVRTAPPAASSPADAGGWSAMTTLTRSAAVERMGGRVIAAFGAVYTIWGSTYLFIRLAEGTIPPLLMAGTRFVVAGALMLAFTGLRGGAGDDRVGPRQWRASGIAG